MGRCTKKVENHWFEQSLSKKSPQRTFLCREPSIGKSNWKFGGVLQPPYPLRGSSPFCDCKVVDIYIALLSTSCCSVWNKKKQTRWETIVTWLDASHVLYRMTRLESQSVTRNSSQSHFFKTLQRSDWQTQFICTQRNEFFVLQWWSISSQLFCFAM